MKRLIVLTLALFAATTTAAAAEPDLFTEEIEREIVIDASRKEVWRVLTDFAAYPEWNPFITHISGALEVGAQIEITVQPCDYPEFTFTPTVQTVDARRELAWLGYFGQPGIFDGFHVFELHRDDGKVRFVQREEFSGTAVPASGPVLDATACGFEGMHEALRERVSKRAM
jgi:hypothetical protein